MGKQFSWFFLISSIFLGAFGQVFLKLAVGRVRDEGWLFYFGLLKEPYLYAGAIAYGASFAVWLLALKYFEIGFARPLVSLGYVVTYIAAILLLGEKILPRRILGIGIITIGVFLLR